MSLPAKIVFAYAALVLVGGLIGYLKAKSRPSLIAGFLSALLLAGAGALMLRDPENGRLAAAVVSGLLTMLFLFRLMRSRKLMPSGMLFFLSAAVCAFLLFCPLAKG